jgi:hypothetical protein
LLLLEFLFVFLSSALLPIFFATAEDVRQDETKKKWEKSPPGNRHTFSFVRLYEDENVTRNETNEKPERTRRKVMDIWTLRLGEGRRKRKEEKRRETWFLTASL